MNTTVMAITDTVEGITIPGTDMAINITIPVTDMDHTTLGTDMAIKAAIMDIITGTTTMPEKNIGADTHMAIKNNDE